MKRYQAFLSPNDEEPFYDAWAESRSGFEEEAQRGHDLIFVCEFGGTTLKKISAKEKRERAEKK